MPARSTASIHLVLLHELTSAALRTEVSPLWDARATDTNLKPTSLTTLVDLLDLIDVTGLAACFTRTRPVDGLAHRAPTLMATAILLTNTKHRLLAILRLTFDVYPIGRAAQGSSRDQTKITALIDLLLLNAIVGLIALGDIRIRPNHDSRASSPTGVTTPILLFNVNETIGQATFDTRWLPVWWARGSTTWCRIYRIRHRIDVLLHRLLKALSFWRAFLLETVEWNKLLHCNSSVSAIEPESRNIAIWSGRTRPQSC